MIGFLYEAGHLKRTPRAGWLLAGVPNPESVAEHSFRVGIIAYVIAAQEGANPDRAATLGLFHDFPEARIGDVPSVGKNYVRTAAPQEVIADQVAGLPEPLGRHIATLIDEHEKAKSTDATLEAKCSRDADKIECLVQAREYEAAGNTQLKPWIDSMLRAVATQTGKELANAALAVPPSIWFQDFAAKFGMPRAVGE
ncbi:HD family hydrolase [Solihabitans fulvus]|uniref:5'-deoxynucleotidase n=2 Tax=Solihabitans fulvus TaxID=1892852 RepID=A0A5B2WBT2_9PSEU|nr:HD family hydrolase [Solihabitans fulvus]